MSGGPAGPELERIEGLISRLLFWGVWASLVLIAGGTALCFFRSGEYGPGGGTAADLSRLLAGVDFPRTLPVLARGWARGEGFALIVSGLLLLIATPVLRVAVSIGAFWAVRDRRFVLITSTVLVLLILSFVLGKAG